MNRFVAAAFVAQGLLLFAVGWFVGGAAARTESTGTPGGGTQTAKDGGPSQRDKQPDADGKAGHQGGPKAGDVTPSQPPKVGDEDDAFKKLNPLPDADEKED